MVDVLHLSLSASGGPSMEERYELMSSDEEGVCFRSHLDINQALLKGFQPSTNPLWVPTWDGWTAHFPKKGRTVETYINPSTEFWWSSKSAERQLSGHPDAIQEHQNAGSCHTRKSSPRTTVLHDLPYEDISSTADTVMLESLPPDRISAIVLGWGWVGTAAASQCNPQPTLNFPRQ